MGPSLRIAQNLSVCCARFKCEAASDVGSVERFSCSRGVIDLWSMIIQVKRLIGEILIRRVLMSYLE